MKSFKQNYNQTGLVKLNNIFTPDEVKKIRASLEKKYKKDKKTYIQYDDWDGFPELVRLIFSKEKFIKSIKALYKNPIFYPDFVIQIENYQKKLVPHQDLQSFYRYGDRRYLKSIQYSKIGFYLQDSNKKNPTSIYAIENSHKSLLTKIGHNLPYFGYKIIKLFKHIFFSFMSQLVELKSGDALVFDGQVMHSSVLKQNNKKNLKINIYFSCVGDKESLYLLIKNEFSKYHLELKEIAMDIDKKYQHQRGYIISNPFNYLNIKKIKFLKRENFFIF